MTTRNVIRWWAVLVVACSGLQSPCRADQKKLDAVPVGKLHYVTLVVKNQDEALQWYVEKLGFEKMADQSFGNGERWLVVAPAGQKDVGIILYNNPNQHLDTDTYHRRIGGETLWVFDCDDATATCATLKQRGVKFTRELEQRPWGSQAIFQDPYGNEFVVVQANHSAPAK